MSTTALVLPPGTMRQTVDVYRVSVSEREEHDIYNKFVVRTGTDNDSFVQTFLTSTV